VYIVLYNQIQLSIVSKKLDSILMKNSVMMLIHVDNDIDEKNDDDDGGYD
jgi:hypothetical protein